MKIILGTFRFFNIQYPTKYWGTDRRVNWSRVRRIPDSYRINVSFQVTKVHDDPIYILLLTNDD